MDKIVSIKRKAQRLAQNGDLEKAVVEFERLVESGDLDPYDYVYFGDLLVRTNRLDQAVERFRDAMSAYERVGLYRNAIAVGKKILRIRPSEYDVCRTLGGLYFMDSLFTDSLSYYQQYLAAAPADREGDRIEEAGLRLLGMPLPTCEIIFAIVEKMAAAGRTKPCAKPLMDLAAEFMARGDKNGSQRLEARAIQIDPDAALGGKGMVPGSRPAESGLRAGESGMGRLELGSQHVRGAAAPAGTPAASNEEASLDFASISLPGDDDGLEDATGAGLFDLSGLAEEPNAEAAAATSNGLKQKTGDGSGLRLKGSDADEPGLISMPGLDENASLLPTVHDDAAGPWAGMDYDAVLAGAEELIAAGDNVAGLDALCVAARMDFKERRSAAAEKLYGRVVKVDPNHLGALEGLVEIAHINGERGKIVRFGCELGDVLLAREEYGRAKLEFERVLQFDPRNDKARSRVARLNSIEGVENVTAQPLAPMASEVSGATVSLRGDNAGAARTTQSLMDLSQILEEFKSAVAGQIPLEDGQSHYDMGMAYLEMGMPDNAASEFETAALSMEHQVPAFEMLARSLLMAGRPQDALNAVEQAASLGIDDPERLAALFTYRGLSLEAMGHGAEAGHAIERALEYHPDFEPAREAMGRLRGASDAA